jgi:diguanylate cyclase (GGDEF)-like protein
VRVDARVVSAYSRTSRLVSTPVIALGAAVAALVLAAVAGVAALRAHRKTASRVQRSLDALRLRVDGLAFELSRGLVELERERRLMLALGELRADADLPSALDASADAVMSLTGADAAVVCLVDDAGTPHVSARGIPKELVGQPPVLWPPDAPRAVRLAFEHTTRDSQLLRIGIAVPLGPPSREQSSVAAFWNEAHEERAAETLEVLESLARRVAPALVHARRQHHEGVAPIDSVTGLAARRAFHELLRREVVAARRLRMPLTLLVVDVDDFRVVNEQLGELGADEVLREVAGTIEASLPSGGSSCRIGGDEFAVILPDSGAAAAEAVVARVQASLARRAGRDGPVAVSAGITELRDADDPVSVFERAKHALQRAKHAPDGASVVVLGYGDMRG